MVTDLITAVLLFGQFGYSRSRGLFVLACGYVFTAFMTVAHALTFPGMFTATGLLGAGPQSTAWLYMFWHGGFPLFVSVYALGKGEATETTGSRSGAVVLGVVGVLAIVCALTVLATAGQDVLPAIMQQPLYRVDITVVSTIWC